MHAPPGMRSLATCVLVAAACAGSSQRVERARAPDRAASVARATYTCGGDPLLSDRWTDGGEHLTNWVPCWDEDQERDAHRRHATRAAIETARIAPAVATRLREIEYALCYGLGARELEHSPLSHTRAIAEVIPHRVGREIRGAHVVFAQVPGLTTGWMRKAIECHRARYEVLGRPAWYHDGDPTLLDDAEITVTKDEGRVQVLVEVPGAANGELALGMARELVPTRTATR